MTCTNKAKHGTTLTREQAADYLGAQSFAFFDLPIKEQEKRITKYINDVLEFTKGLS